MAMCAHRNGDAGSIGGEAITAASGKPGTADQPALSLSPRYAGAPAPWQPLHRRITMIQTKVTRTLALAGFAPAGKLGPAIQKENIDETNR